MLVGGGERRGQSPHLRCPSGISCLISGVYSGIDVRETPEQSQRSVRKEEEEEGKASKLGDPRFRWEEGKGETCVVEMEG